MKLRILYRCAFLMMSFLFMMTAATVLPAVAKNRSDAPRELVQPSYLFEVVRHLYRWHLYETDIESIAGAKQLIFWVHRLEPKLDSGDRSLLGEILLPQLNLIVKVKKADYTIEELGTAVKSENFKIIQITRAMVPLRKQSSYEEVLVDMKEMMDYLFRTRSQRDYPDEKLIERLRVALRKQVAEEGLAVGNASEVEQIVHLAPLSPVANETWVFWEAGHKLFYFASDIDLANPAVWEHESMMARIFDVEQQVVVSNEESPGSNRFLTRYQASRALYNCIVLGRRVTVPPYTQSSGVVKSMPLEGQ